MKKIIELFEQYKKIEFIPSIEFEREQLYEYVYATNKLEGNKLTLAQTTQLLSNDTITGDQIRTTDILEQKGMYKALSRMLKAARDKEDLSVDLMLELNRLTLGYLWKYDDAYLHAKSKGQQEGQFKISKNKIEIREAGKLIETIEPLSLPDTVEKNMQQLVNTINESNKSVLDKAVYLAQEVWLHQPFVDGNKRTGRLLINFLLMKEGYPLFSFESESKNYNSLLVQQYMDAKEGLLKDYITNLLIKKMEFYIKANKPSSKKNKGFRMVL